MSGSSSAGIASDFCEGHGPEFWRYLGRIHGTTPYWDVDVPRENPTVHGIRGAEDTLLIAEALRDRGYADADVGKVMAGNWLRLYREVWDDAPAAHERG